MNCRKINRIITELLIVLLAINYMIIEVVLKDIFFLSSLRDILLLILLYITVSKYKMRLNKTTLFLIIFMFLAVLSVFNTDSLTSAILSIRRYFFPFIILICLSNIDIDNNYKLIDFIIIFMAFLSVWGIFQADVLGDTFLRKLGYPLVYSPFYGRDMLYNSFYFGGLGIQRVVSTFSSSNIYGLCSGIVLIAAICLYKFLNIKHKDLAIIFIFAGYLLSFSRSNFLALIILLIAYLRKYIPNRKMIRLGIFMLIIVFIAIGIVQGKSGLLYKLFTWVVSTFAGKESSSAGRPDIWKTAFHEAISNPLGIGYGHVGGMANAAYSEDQVFSAENSYLTIALDIGWLGLAVYLLFLFSLINKFTRQAKIFKKNNDYLGNRLCVCGYTILLYVSIVMLFSNHIQDMECICFAYVFVGIALKYIHIT